MVEFEGSQILEVTGNEVFIFAFQLGIQRHKYILN